MSFLDPRNLTYYIVNVMMNRKILETFRSCDGTQGRELFQNICVPFQYRFSLKVDPIFKEKQTGSHKCLLPFKKENGKKSPPLKGDLGIHGPSSSS